MVTKLALLYSSLTRRKICLHIFDGNTIIITDKISDQGTPHSRYPQLALPVFHNEYIPEAHKSNYIYSNTIIDKVSDQRMPHSRYPQLALPVFHNEHVQEAHKSIYICSNTIIDKINCINIDPGHR